MEFSGLVPRTALDDGHRVSLAEDLVRFQSLWLPIYEQHRVDVPWPLDVLQQWSRRWEYPYAFYHLSRHAQRGQRVLDAGCGITCFPFYLALHGYQVHACDSDSELTSAYGDVNRELPAACLVEFRTADLANLPYEPGSFAGLCCISVFEHLDPSTREACLRQFHQVLASDGILVLTLDVDLEEDGREPITYSRFQETVSLIGRYFDFVYPVAAPAPPVEALLRTDDYRTRERHRLPWVHPPSRLFPRVKHAAKKVLGKLAFRSVAVAGFVLKKKSL